ncbi:MAG: hypothetical protein CSB23_03150 [Deltaproteobacteria bacterium]|nr:MAG: hypothetical protein CSB23_03150 [Deltaproteobacteria bacterium]
MVRSGLEVFLDSASYILSGERLGYLSNQASTTSQLVQGRYLLRQRFGPRLTTLFSPQHGFFAEKQDNMIESEHFVDSETRLPVYSLYGELRRPSPEMFENLDVLVVDLVDVGTRVYTFIYTLAYCLMTAAETGKRVIVLDRPNPVGGQRVEGNILQDHLRSFVGMYPLPMRHGLTIGELARLMNSEFAIDADLTVVPLEGWSRDMYFADTGLPWVAPSPNMPSPACALVYPGQVLWEGTNVSEGRGTTQPFEFVGAPFWNQPEILDFLQATDLPGCYLRPIVFQPTSGKWAGQACKGFQVHVTDRDAFLPYRTSLALLQAAILLYPDAFAYKEPPYEYEYRKLPIDILLGDNQLRGQLEAGEKIEAIEQKWLPELAAFASLKAAYLLYE